MVTRPPSGTREEIRTAMEKRYRYVWGLWLQGLTQAQIAKRTKVTPSRVAQILNGYVRITRRGSGRTIEGDNWEAKSRFLPPLLEYRVRTQ